MDRRNLGSELKSTTLSGREFQVFMMRSLKNAALTALAAVTSVDQVNCIGLICVQK